MADNKRNSMSAKVATPKSSGTPPHVETYESLGKAIGGRVRITTAAPVSQTLEGTLYTACPILNVIAIDTRVSPVNAANGTGTQTGDYRIIPISRVQSFQLLSLADAPQSIINAQPTIGVVDEKRVQERLDARIKKLKEDEVNRGKGVSKQGQAIFDALKRVNIPIRWHDQQMVAHEAVIISPPYRPEDCKGSKDKQQVLNQVKKVLEGETRKLKEREDRERKAASPAGSQRKGG